MMDTASISVIVLTWAGVFLLIVGHHLTDLLIWRTAEDRSELSGGWRGLDSVFKSMIFLHLSVATATEVGAVLCFAFAAYQNADTRSASTVGAAKNQDGWTATEVKTYLVLAGILIVVCRAALSYQHVGTGADIWDGIGRWGPWTGFHLAYAGGWVLLSVCVNIDKEYQVNFLSWFGGGLVGGGGMLVSALHYGRKNAPYLHPAAMIGQSLGRFTHLGGVVLLAVANMYKTESSL